MRLVYNSYAFVSSFSVSSITLVTVSLDELTCDKNCFSQWEVANTDQSCEICSIQFQGTEAYLETLAAKMKEGGYAIHQVGKWPIGLAMPIIIPRELRGFDTSFGYLDGTSYEEGMFQDRFLEVHDPSTPFPPLLCCSHCPQTDHTRYLIS